jgi:hypothetical protein
MTSLGNVENIGCRVLSIPQFEGSPKTALTNSPVSYVVPMEESVNSVNTPKENYRNRGDEW